MGINDVEPTKLILRVAEELKGIDEMKAPEWAPFVKTGISRERAPLQRDWWHLRAASVLRKMFVRGPIGVSKLRTLYGSTQNRGMKPDRFKPSAGNHLRKILQQLEKAGLAKQAQKGAHKGRIVTPKGHSLLEKMANEIMKTEGIVLPKKEAKPKKAAKKAPAKAEETVEKKAEEKKAEVKAAPKAEPVEAKKEAKPEESKENGEQ